MSVQLVVKRMKTEGLLDVPMYQKKSRRRDDAWDVFELLAVSADPIVIEEKEENSISVKQMTKCDKEIADSHVRPDHDGERCIIRLVVNRYLEDRWKVRAMTNFRMDLTDVRNYSEATVWDQWQERAEHAVYQRCHNIHHCENLILLFLHLRYAEQPYPNHVRPPIVGTNNRTIEIEKMNRSDR